MDKLISQSVVGTPIVFNDLQVNFDCVTYHIKPENFHCQIHSHDYYEFYLILQGKQYTIINGVETLNDAGKFFLVPPGVQHGHRHYFSETDRGIVVRFTLKKMQIKDCSALADRIIQTLSVAHTCAFFDKQIIEMLSRAESQSKEEAQLSMLKWLIRLYVLLDNDTNVAQSPMQRQVINEKELVQNVIISIDTLYMRDIDVKQLALLHNISYRHLSRIFVNETGYTLTEWITFARVRSAMSLLSETDLSIGEISCHSGFRTESYFCNVFNRVTGVTPSKYRKTRTELNYVPITAPGFSAQNKARHKLKKSKAQEDS